MEDVIISDLKNVNLFVDGGYLAKINTVYIKNYEIKHDIDPKTQRISLDHRRFFDLICETLNFRRKWTYYFDCPWYTDKRSTPEENRKATRKKKFLNRLENFPRTTVELGYLQKTILQCKDEEKFVFRQKKVDILIALRIVDKVINKECMHSILMTGDSDFVPVVKMVQDYDGEVILAYADIKGRVHKSYELLQAINGKLKIEMNFWENCIVKTLYL